MLGCELTERYRCRYIKFGSDSSSSKLQTQEFPGIFGDPNSGTPATTRTTITDAFGQPVDIGTVTSMLNEGRDDDQEPFLQPNDIRRILAGQGQGFGDFGVKKQLQDLGFNMQTEDIPGSPSQLQKSGEFLGETLGIPGDFTDPSQVIGLRAGQVAESLANPFASETGGELENILLGRSQQGPNVFEEALIDDIISQTQGASALRNVEVTPGAISSAIAPTLANVRQQQIQNLINTLIANTGSQGASLTGLLELAGLATPQIVAGNKSSSSGFSGGIGG